MSWYSKYTDVFEKEFDDIPKEVIETIKSNLKRFKCDNPVASVVVIAHNEQNTLVSCLWALSESICDFPIEIIGVNNNSTDRTAEVFDALGVKWFWEERQSCGYARQCGLDHAKGVYYISIDSDIIYPPLYIQTMVDHLRAPGIIAVSSRYSYIPDVNHPRLALKVYEFARDIHIFLQSFQRPEMSVRGGVFAYAINAGRAVGYRVEIKVGEDGSMALGLKQYGRIKLISNRRSRAATFTRTLDAKGSIFVNLIMAIRKYVGSPSRYFIKKDKYEDVESNLLNP